MLNCGDTFYAGDDEDVEPHLQVVVTPPHHGEVITVSITTKHACSESLVVLRVNDHPFIKWDSVVSYGYAAIRKVADIESAIHNGRAAKRDPISPHILRKIRMGLNDSEFTPNGVRHFYFDLSIEED